MDKVQATPRDFVLARLAAARTLLGSLVEGLDGLIDIFAEPSIDKHGDEREEVFKALLEDAGTFSRTLECAQAVFESLSPTERREGEPDYDAILGDEDQDGEPDDS